MTDSLYGAVDYREPGMREELERVHARLLDVLFDLVHVWPRRPMVISVERTPGQAGIMGSKSPHTTHPCRACDIRTHDIAELQIANAASFLNRRWSYDPTRPSKMVANIETGLTPGATGPHLHIQVHDATVLRAEWLPPRPELL